MKEEDSERRIAADESVMSSFINPGPVLESVLEIAGSDAGIYG